MVDGCGVDNAGRRPSRCRPVDSPAVAPPKRKTGGGRTTVKGTRPGEAPRTASGRNEGQKYANPDENRAGVHASSRYTPPVPAEMKMPKAWVPYLMVSLFVAGMVVIMLRNLVWHSNWLTLAGLGAILGGLYTATKWR
jgi:hypothetical protein